MSGDRRNGRLKALLVALLGLLSLRVVVAIVASAGVTGAVAGPMAAQAIEARNATTTTTTTTAAPTTTVPPTTTAAPTTTTTTTTTTEPPPPAELNLALAPQGPLGAEPTAVEVLVTNQGAGPATDVIVLVRSGGLSVDVVRPAGWTCTGGGTSGQLRCTRPRIGPDKDVSFTLQVATTGDAAVSLDAVFG